MDDKQSLDKFIQVLKNMLMSPTLPVLPEELAVNGEFESVYSYMKAMREILQKYAQGNLSASVPIKGFFGGNLKALQANLNHLSWQVQRVADGDFTQRVDFMGEFSAAFNAMVTQLKDTLEELRRQEDRMQKIAADLRKEIDVRAKIEDELKRSQERYQELARTDSLTNLYNRRYFFELAIAELERMKRGGSTCCIGMLDVDYFKKFNDTYGHVRGDRCLSDIAEKLKEQTRKIDLIGRYGGEEFIFMLPQTKIATGMLVANRIRTTIGTSPIIFDNIKINISVSIGMTEIHMKNLENDDDMNDVLLNAVNEADLALYEAKRAGRNKTYSYYELTPDNTESLQ